MTEKSKVTYRRMAAIVVGLIAIILGIIFEKQNVNFLVGLAYAIAASAYLPAILMLLFWKNNCKGYFAGDCCWGLIRLY